MRDVNVEPIAAPRMASQFTAYSAITETTARVLGDALTVLEPYQHFAEKGTAVRGGTAATRTWNDKSFLPITLANQCIDCLHCVVACPHQSIGYEITDAPAGAWVPPIQRLVSRLTDVALDPKTTEKQVIKGRTDFGHCKGCFVCASACPTGAIHFVAKDLVDESRFGGQPLELESVADI